MSRVAFIFCLMLLPASAGAVPIAGRITELLLGPATDGPQSYPAYVEVTVSDAAAPFDLVVFDASADRAWTAKAVARFTPGLHPAYIAAAQWPLDSPLPGQLAAFVNLQLVQPAGAARALVLFDHATDFTLNAITPQLPGNPHILDALFYSVDGPVFSWSARAFGSYPNLKLPMNGAAYRPIEGEDLAAYFIAGPLVDGLELAGGISLDPGLVNFAVVQQPSHTPEPGAGAMIGAGMLAGWARRRRSSKREAA